MQGAVYRKGWNMSGAIAEIKSTHWLRGSCPN